METTSAVQIEKVKYGGWPNCYRMSNGSVELIVTADVGPRVLRYGFVDGQNLFKEFPEQLGKSGESSFQARGGHRLWKAPEDLAITWFADNHPVEIHVHGSELVTIAPVESPSGLQKEIQIRMANVGSGVTVTHHIANRSMNDLAFAPWAMTVMAPGGIAVAGLPARAKYPDKLAPTNPLVMWAYTDLSDPRWTLLRKYLVLRQDAKSSAPQKIGLFNEDTWACYLLHAEMFVKYAKASAAETYADFGCSLELFTNDEFLEMETLGPMRVVAPSEVVEHVERWSLHRGVNIGELNESLIDRVMLPLLEMEEPC